MNNKLLNIGVNNETILGVFTIIIGMVVLYFMYNSDFSAYVSIETIFQKSILVLIGIAALIMGAIFIANDNLNKEK